ncbi:MAG: ATP-binding protein [Dehalococcoidia bacterium]
MTPERARELIADGETLAVEFKGESRGQIADAEIVQCVVCLANRGSSSPGWLLIGVEDDGTVTGAKPRHETGTTDVRRIEALIANNTRPSLSCQVESIVLDGKPVLVVEVDPLRTPVGTADGRYLRRALGGRGKPECLPFFFHEMQARQADQGFLDYSSLVVPSARWEDLDPLEFQRFRRTVREGRGLSDRSLADLPDVEIAKALGAVEANHDVSAVRVLGLLLFGTEEALRQFLPAHEVAFQVLFGTDVEVNEFFRWPLLRTMDELLVRVQARNREEEILVGALRVGVPNYPPRAIREGIANALIHRDYTRLGAVHVQWHDSRLEISNPGGFPEGVRLDNLLVTPPRPRNPLLADAFKRAGIVERTARGIDTIFEEQLRSGRPAPSYDRSTEAAVVLVLPGGRANLDFVRLVVEQNQTGDPLGLDDLLTLNHLWLERRLTTTHVATLIQKPEAEARAVLERLVEVGLVVSRGERQTRSYHLSASTYRRLGAEAEYVRQRGFEPLQQEQMVLQFVQAHDRITRGQVAELCQMSSLGARALLARMVRRGLLQQRGTRRTAYYVAKPQTLDLFKQGLDTSKNLGSRSKT